MNYLLIAIFAVIAYLLGSINSSILIGRLFGVKDIRKHGSGNAGATNTLRTIGKKAAILALIGDALKGVIAILLTRLVLGMFIEGDLLRIAQYISGVAAVLGHNFPIFFQFKGGKGIVTTAAVGAMMNPFMALIVIAIGVGTIIISKYVSLGSVTAMISYPILVAVTGGDAPYIIFSTVLMLLAVIKHRANIKRLIKHEESKITSKKA
ncbi:MAG: glycerol-3-phosphate 1-O-acyltransferase PlsY [Clostridia bacterium]|nr:glycerol-3-phosphate 1-O-acyltransferase PlsY [Clostridia bacterium]MBR2972588.1 glycerol-3-phosphate 1-O-acyltransferase PlsY [Clostridia bacterium]